MEALKAAVAASLLCAAGALYAVEPPPTAVATPPHQVIPVPPPADVPTGQPATAPGKQADFKAVMHPQHHKAHASAKHPCKHRSHPTAAKKAAPEPKTP